MRNTAVRLAFLLVVSIIFSSGSALAGEVGQYDAVRLSDSIGLLVDTKEGHLWLLGGSMSADSEKVAGVLSYMGQLRPGGKMGDLIETIEIKRK